MQALTYSALLRESAYLSEAKRCYSAPLGVRERSRALYQHSFFVREYSRALLRHPLGCQILMSMEMSQAFTECVSAPEEM